MNFKTLASELKSKKGELASLPPMEGEEPQENAKRGSNDFRSSLLGPWEKELAELQRYLPVLIAKSEAARERFGNAQQAHTDLTTFMSEHPIDSDDILKEYVLESSAVSDALRTVEISQRDVLENVMPAAELFVDLTVEQKNRSDRKNAFYLKAGGGGNLGQGIKAPPFSKIPQKARTNFHRGFLRPHFGVLDLGTFKATEEHPAEVRELLEALLKAQVDYKAAIEKAQKAGFPCEM